MVEIAQQALETIIMTEQNGGVEPNSPTLSVDDTSWEVLSDSSTQAHDGSEATIAEKKMYAAPPQDSVRQSDHNMTTTATSDNGGKISPSYASQQIYISNTFSSESSGVCNIQEVMDVEAEDIDAFVENQVDESLKCDGNIMDAQVQAPPQDSIHNMTEIYITDTSSSERNGVSDVQDVMDVEDDVVDEGSHNVVDGSLDDGNIMDIDGNSETSTTDSYSIGTSDSDDIMKELQDDDKASTTSRHFDVNLVVQNIELGAPVINQVKGRDCVLIVGKTGTGKSTLIQALAGKKFVEHEHISSLEMNVSKKVYEAIDPLPGFQIGHERMSKTSTIECYDPSSDGMSTVEGSGLVFLDSPGFEDTRGHEIDIATSALLSQVAGHCKSLKFVIMISYVSLLEDRGNAMRSVLRLIRNFTRNFEEEWKSFMFLFTHSNEIKGVPDNIDGAKNSLHEEIIQTIKGTTDDAQTKQILLHLHKCLKKKNPFVDVFMPLQTDGLKLGKFIQKRMKPTENSYYISKSSVLTPSSMLSLSGEMQRILTEFRKDLCSNDPLMSAISNAIKLFQVCEHYINVDCVRRAKQEAEDLLKTFIHHQIDKIEEGMKRLTSANQDFGDCHALSMKEASQRLEVLERNNPNSVDYQKVEIKMREQLESFCITLVLEPGQGFLGVHKSLSQLLVLSKYFPRLEYFYADTINHLQKLISEYFSKYGSGKIDADLLLEKSYLTEIFQFLSVLNSIENDKEPLALHKLDTQRVSNLYRALVSNIQCETQKWFIRVQTELGDTKLTNEKINLLAQVSMCFDEMVCQGDKYIICKELKKALIDLHQKLVCDINGFFESIGPELETSKLTNPDDLEHIIQHTHLASELFREMGNGLFRRMLVAHETIIEEVKSSLTKRVGRINQISQEMKKLGMKDGMLCARLFRTFEAMKWFDNMLPDDAFVENVNISFEQSIKDRAMYVKKEINTVLDQITDESRDSKIPCKMFKTLLLECKEISLFGRSTNLNLYTTMETQARQKFYLHVLSFDNRYKNYPSEWKGILTRVTESDIDEIDIKNEKIEFMLRKIECFTGIDQQSDSTLNTMTSSLDKTFCDVSNEVKITMNSSKVYNKKLRFLKILRSLSKYPGIKEKMPDMKELQLSVRNTIASDAKEIEDLMLKTSEWDKIDTLINQFEKAKKLDEFTQNEASSRLSPLLGLRKKKQEKVDELIDELIQNEDFKGIGDFLLPYATSRDQVTVSKFQKWLEKISSSLCETVGSLSSCVEEDISNENCDKIVDGIEKLEDAKTQLNTYASSLPGGLDIEEEVVCIKSNLNKKFHSLLNDFTEAIQKQDFESMGRSFYLLNVYKSSTITTYIKSDSQNRLKILEGEYESARRNVSKVMSVYLHSHLTEGASFFHHVLHSLKNSTEYDSPSFPELQKLYKDIINSLVCELNNMVDMLCKLVSRTQCFDDAIDFMSLLDKDLNHMLADHIVESDLSFKSGKLLKELREAKNENDSDMEFDISNAEQKLIKWKDTLNKLDPSMNGRISQTINQFRTRTTYTSKQSKISRIIVEMAKKAKRALEDSDHILFEQCIYLLDLIDSHLRTHVPSSGNHCRNLQQMAKEQFLNLCKHAQELLQSDKSLQFRGFFSDYRGYAKLKCIMIDGQCQKEFSATNQLVHIRLTRDIEKIHILLDECKFDKVRNEMMKVTKFGGFVADHFTLLKEELDRCSHSKCQDMWLRKIYDVCDEYFSGEPPFSPEIKGIRESLRKKVKSFMDEQRYEKVENILYAMDDLKLLKNLVTPALDDTEIVDDIHNLIKSYVKEAKTTVSTNWAEKDYKSLNDNINDLKMMEERFKSNENIFPSSWNDGIIEEVKEEILTLGRRARGYLSSKKSVKENQDDFRRCFIEMGNVLVELPLFRDFTKTEMCNLLEACLDLPGVDGYGFLFEFGLSLRKNDDNGNEKDNNIAQMLLAEFSQFKEVLTMVWNEETSQKPAGDTVNGIKGRRRVGDVESELPLDRALLLESFNIFDAEYKKLLGEYIVPEADLKALVMKMNNLAKELKPIDLKNGWNKKVKNQVPHILAGIFTVFTVLKSGESFNRISETSTVNGEKLLMKPHNIQVLTLLSLFGCGSSSSTELSSQLMQIRTGEGKSMILGAASILLALLGFRVRCVCYSDYLSTRDYNLFHDIFDMFLINDLVKYSKITTLSEETTHRKGDIRHLTNSMLRGNIDKLTNSRSPNPLITIDDTLPQQEILLVDEVDVFFGGDFYGQTYNQVTQFREPEIESILKHIWIANKKRNRKQRLKDIKKLPFYHALIKKMPGFQYLVDSEISKMIDQVRKVDEEPYFLDPDRDRIGYKVMDSISYDVTYGYRTVFAYLKEADKKNLKNEEETLKRALSMPISCGQFSYAEIAPECILGVSGTLSALGDYEYNVLSKKYGVETYLYVPSVYGQSNFQFDKAGRGIRIDMDLSDYFHSITSQIKEVIEQNRSVIVFFENNKRLEDFTNSHFHAKLGRQKKLLTEDMGLGEKEFVISKAATSKQITLSTAVFGRGTDFFCKDESVIRNGGVHVIQTFLSEELSEEIQIQGRTARQGKKGSYEMILLASDLAEKYNLPENMKDIVAKESLYEELCEARRKLRNKHHTKIEENLVDATSKDKATHLYFDSLLAKKHYEAANIFKEIYTNSKKQQVSSSIQLDISLLVDTTGSMAPYVESIMQIISVLLKGDNSIVEKLNSNFPDIEFAMRVGALCYRDFDDDSQFLETNFSDACHFTDDVDYFISFLHKMIQNPQGGDDVAEDHLGAIDKCSKWNSFDDWTAPIKFMLLFTDAPTHGMVSEGSTGISNFDNYCIVHPLGLTGKSVVESLIENEIDLLFCSFNPSATSSTEKTLSTLCLDHPRNSELREVISIPILPGNNSTVFSDQVGGLNVKGCQGKHMIFVLDMSSSMKRDWSGVVAAYNQFIACRKQSQNESDLVSVIQFDNSAKTTVEMATLSNAPNTLGYCGRGTSFSPAAKEAFRLASQTPCSYTTTVIFMSDGEAYEEDAVCAAEIFRRLNLYIRQSSGRDLELHVIAFKCGASTTQLQNIVASSNAGKLHTSADTIELSDIFVEIASSGESVANILEVEIGKRISDVVSDKLSLEYIE